MVAWSELRRPRRAGSSSRSPTAETPPPTTTASGSRAETSPAIPTPSQVPTVANACARHGMAVPGEGGHLGAVEVRTESDPHDPFERAAAAVLLPAAPEAALADQSVRDHLDVPELPRHAVGAAHHPAVEDHRATDAGADGDEQRRRDAAEGAGDELGVRGAVRVVVEYDGHADPLREPVAHRRVPPRQVGGEPDALARAVDQPGGGHSHPGQWSAGGDVERRLRHRLLDLGVGRGPTGHRYLCGGRDDQVAALAGQLDGEHLRPADIDPDVHRGVPRSARGRRRRSCRPGCRARPVGSPPAAGSRVR